MPSTQDARNILETYLEMKWEVVTKQGDQINVGEPFTVRFTLESKADTAEGYPSVVFENLSMRVKPTDYTSLISTGLTNIRGTLFTFPDQTLYSGRSTFVDVEFKAEQNMADEGWWPWTVDHVFGAVEKIAEITVWADFHAREGKLRPKDMYTEIDSG